jgi:hypothetical protein
MFSRSHCSLTVLGVISQSQLSVGLNFANYSMRIFLPSNELDSRFNIFNEISLVVSVRRLSLATPIKVTARVLLKNLPSTPIDYSSRPGKIK